MIILINNKKRKQDMNLPEIPKESVGDLIHKIIRAGLGAIPIAGTGAIEFFNSIILPPITKKREAFLQDIIITLSELEKKVEDFSIDSVQTNDIFISTLIHALKIEMQTHQKEKIELLKNVIMNTALNIFEDDDDYTYYLSILEDISVKEFQALLILEKYQDKTPKGFSTDIPLSKKHSTNIPDKPVEDVYNLWQIYEKELYEKLNIPETEVKWFMERLARTGLFMSQAGYYQGYFAGKGKLTDLYFKFKKLVTLDLI